ncbi:hypothetical protein COLO4_26756 [Corchorus olitorius]|uniref:Uncharacterized protein n=1 Tax=Corchorus olitorius TaxID=93759 RepID=A0A1R3HUC5_9ROSI|nr:hypothetical protein COLO4_26756 [Corchorus olitorius]
MIDAFPVSGLKGKCWLKVAAGFLIFELIRPMDKPLDMPSNSLSNLRDNRHCLCAQCEISYLVNRECSVTFGEVGDMLLLRKKEEDSKMQEDLSRMQEDYWKEDHPGICSNV